VLVSDLGKVLLPFDAARALANLTPHSDLPTADLGALLRGLHDELGFGRGAISGEAFHRRAVEAADLRLDFDDFLIAWSDMFWVDDAVVRLLRQTRVERRWLMSNTNDLHWRFIRERYPAPLAMFERCIVSHELGLEKPDARVFEWLIAETGLAPEEHLFIDDRAPNVAAARAAGMDAILHTDAAALQRELSGRRLLPE